MESTINAVWGPFYSMMGVLDYGQHMMHYRASMDTRDASLAGVVRGSTIGAPDRSVLGNHGVDHESFNVS